jgi:hypothetical protein
MDKLFTKNSHIEIIRQIAIGLKVVNRLDRYLELGVQKGSCFNRVAPLAKEAYAVDIINSFDLIKENKNLIWFQGYTTDFLYKHDVNKKFDLVFIDADHKHEASLLDFKTVLPLVNFNGLILLHDTYPPSEEYTSPKYCYDTYKTADYIRRNIPEVEIVTIPLFFGLSIVRNLNRQLLWKI